MNRDDTYPKFHILGFEVGQQR